jgi:vacuolar-type H+-ATPase subunit H
MTDPDQYDGFATPEELNLSQEEIETLRNNKKQITEYASEKIREKIIAIGKECMMKYDKALKKLADS